MTERIENQIERFAPGFRDVIAARRVMNTSDLENYNANYLGGDINGGRKNISQLFSRPVLFIDPYLSSEKGLFFFFSSSYLCYWWQGKYVVYASNTDLNSYYRL